MGTVLFEPGIAIGYLLYAFYFWYGILCLQKRGRYYEKSLISISVFLNFEQWGTYFVDLFFGNNIEKISDKYIYCVGQTETSRLTHLKGDS